MGDYEMRTFLLAIQYFFYFSQRRVGSCVFIFARHLGSCTLKKHTVPEIANIRETKLSHGLLFLNLMPYETFVEVVDVTSANEREIAKKGTPR